MNAAAAAADAADMRALRAGESPALDRLMQRWQQPLQSYLARLVGDPHEARDLAQETFVRVFRHASRFHPGARFSTWMFQIALNLARDHLRRRSRRPTTSVDFLAASPDAAPSPLRATEDAEIAVAVRDAIHALPDSFRDVLLLATYQHIPHAEIACIVGTSVKAVESRLHRASDLLRARLRRWY